MSDTTFLLWDVNHEDLAKCKEISWSVRMKAYLSEEGHTNGKASHVDGELPARDETAVPADVAAPAQDGRGQG